MEEKRKLQIELVPDGCWHSNLRYFLSPKEWEFIKQYTKQRFNNTCQICGKQTKFLDAHEVWSYDEKKGVQKLEDVICVCKDCHSAIHIDFTALKGNLVNAEDHYMKVNNCSYAEYKDDLNKAHARHKELNKVGEWKTDLKWLLRFTDDKK